MHVRSRWRGDVHRQAWRVRRQAHAGHRGHAPSDLPVLRTRAWPLGPGRTRRRGHRRAQRRSRGDPDRLPVLQGLRQGNAARGGERRASRRECTAQADEPASCTALPLPPRRAQPLVSGDGGKALAGRDQEVSRACGSRRDAQGRHLGQAPVRARAVPGRRQGRDRRAAAAQAGHASLAGRRRGLQDGDRHRAVQRRRAKRLRAQAVGQAHAGRAAVHGEQGLGARRARLCGHPAGSRRRSGAQTDGRDGRADLRQA